MGERTDRRWENANDPHREVVIPVLEVPLLAGRDCEDQFLDCSFHPLNDQLRERSAGGSFSDYQLPLRRTGHSSSQVAIVGSKLCPVESLDYEYIHILSSYSLSVFCTLSLFSVFSISISTNLTRDLSLTP